MTITASLETVVDYHETARIAAAAFAAPDATFAADQLRWSYERCFRHGTTTIALRDGGRKVGQFAMMRQALRSGGVTETAAQLVDLFILKDYRGRDRLKTLYDAIEAQFVEQDIRFAIAMPNRKAGPINAHFLKLDTFAKLPIHIGASVPTWSRRSPTATPFEAGAKASLLPLLARYRTPEGDGGLPWDEHSLFERLSGPKFRYGLHALDDVLLISSPRERGRLRYTLVCCLLTAGDAPVRRADVGAVVRSACRMWDTRMFVYVGINGRIGAMPGFAMPDRLRPSPMIIQLRDFKPDRPPLRLDRYELIDFDFA